MATMYETPWGPSWQPVEVTMWTSSGRPLGPVADVEELELRVSMAEVDTLELVAGLRADNAALLEVGGGVLVAVRAGGVRFVGVPSVVRVESADDVSAGRVRVTAAGPRSMLAGQVVVADPGLPLGAQPPSGRRELVGPAESVVHAIVSGGARVAGHPLVAGPDQGRGPRVRLVAEMDDAESLVRRALAGSGLWLDWVPRLPGDAVDGGQVVSPVVAWELRPYRRRPGLVWSADGGDLDEWRVEHRRPTVTSAVVGQRLADDGSGSEQPRRFSMADGPQSTQDPWGRRLGYLAVDADADAGAAAADYLVQHSGGEVAEVTLMPSGQWRPGRDGGQGEYWLGDVVEVVLPVLGRIEQVVTEIVVRLDSDGLRITPHVGAPDSVSGSVHDAVAGVAERVARLERRL